MATVVSTSRVGRKPVPIPQGVEIKQKDALLIVKGPFGQQQIPLHPYVHLSIEASSLHVKPNEEIFSTISSQSIKLYRSIAGTTRACISNSIEGVSKGFIKKLVLVGVGYRAQIKGKTLLLNLGFSLPVEFAIPEQVTIETPLPTEIIVKGANKQDVGLFAAQIRSMRPPEPYKGKGVRYASEKVEIKETKKK